jgi:hypothetical protein
MQHGRLATGAAAARYASTHSMRYCRPLAVPLQQAQLTLAHLSPRAAQVEAVHARGLGVRLPVCSGIQQLVPQRPVHGSVTRWQQISRSWSVSGR